MYMHKFLSYYKLGLAVRIEKKKKEGSQERADILLLVGFLLLTAVVIPVVEASKLLQPKESMRLFINKIFYHISN